VDLVTSVSDQIKQLLSECWLMDIAQCSLSQAWSAGFQFDFASRTRARLPSGSRFMPLCSGNRKNQRKVSAALSKQQEASLRVGLGTQYAEQQIHREANLRPESQTIFQGSPAAVSRMALSGSSLSYLLFNLFRLHGPRRPMMRDELRPTVSKAVRLNS